MGTRYLCVGIYVSSRYNLTMKCTVCHTELSERAVYCHACGTLQAGAVEATDYEYAAFISYRHLPRDQQIAIEVQKAIETYRLPQSIVPAFQRESRANNGHDRHLGKCFRDEDELTATHSLPDRITKALARSSALVVVCSPDTPNSDWVKREIETFAQLHGRERIFAVLADGASAESIPQLLMTRMTADGQGAVSAIHTGPLAADLRPGSSANAKLEKLRIVAAIAGCEFDDLRQRDQKRKRKRIASAAIAAALIAIAIAAISTFALQNAREAQISESKRLAAESQQLLEQGDRYGAIEIALEALPSSENDASRPVVDEARDALEAALEIHPSQESIWQASYSIQTEHTLGLVDDTAAHAEGEEVSKASAIAVSERGGFFAISDNAGTVTTYDIRTGRKLATCTMPEVAGPVEGDLYSRTLATANDLIIVSNAGTPGVVACFEGTTGKTLWSKTGVTFPAIDTSYNDGYAVMAQPNADGGFSAAVVDARTGDYVTAHDFSEPGRLSTPTGIHVTSGRTIGELYIAAGDALVLADLRTNEVKSTTLAYSCATSVAYADGVLVVATADEMPEDDVLRGFAIQAFDDDLGPLWSYKGTLTSEMLSDGDYVAFLAAEPAIHGFTLDDQGVAVSAGREALVLERATGKAAFQRTYDQSVIDMRPLSDDAGAYDKTFIACSNGTLTQKDLSGIAQDREGDSERLVLPFPVRWACIAIQDSTVTAITIPANANDRIVAFHADYAAEATPERDYSLDELIALAHETLAQESG